MPKRNGLVAYVSALFGLASQFALCKVSSQKKLFNTSLPRIATGTQYAWGKFCYFSLLSRVYGEIALLIGFIQDRLIDLQASLDQMAQIKIFHY